LSVLQEIAMYNYLPLRPTYYKSWHIPSTTGK